MIPEEATDINDMLMKSRQRLMAARLLCKEGLYEDAVNRAYYAMHLSASALLARKGILVKTHAGLISAIGLHYIRSGELAVEHGRALNRIEVLREEVDYNICTSISLDDVSIVISQADAFIDQVERIIVAEKT
ncbi:HEPN domain-containing protein [Methanocalculus sp. MC3]